MALDANPSIPALHVAIIGGGITGLALAVGLLRRNVNVTVYERAAEIRELGAGIGFTPNAERAMRAIDPRIHAHMRQIAVQNGDDWFRYVNGMTSGSHEGDWEKTDVMFKIYLGERGFEGCRRSDFLDGLLAMLPKEVLILGKDLETLEDQETGDVRMRFKDGSSATADVVIGCDGIKSVTRHLVCGLGYHADYSHKFAYRGLIPMTEARAALGSDKTCTRVMYLGPDAHTLTFPVAEGQMLNVVTFVTDPEPWSGGLEQGRFVVPATKAEAVAAYKDFGPDVRKIISLLPEQLDKWGIFDMYDDPVPYYAKGRVCLAGGAAHASSPHHGAGAGCGIEDALVLTELLAQCGRENVGDALEVYNAVRYGRSQWLVRTSREVGKMYEWQNPEVGRDGKKFGEEFRTRCHKIWDYDVDGMVVEALKVLGERVGKRSNGGLGGHVSRE